MVPQRVYLMVSEAERLKELLSDRAWRLNNLYSIKDKAGKKIAFKLNWAQRKLYACLWYFNIILKARQLGFTTFIMIYFLDACLFNSNHAAGVIAHTKDDAQDLFDNKVKFAYDNLPDWLKAEIPAEQDSAKKLVFKNGSSFTVGTSLRSGTYQKLLVSEYGKVSAKYPQKAKEIKTGALNTVEVGQQTFIESTAEGKTGEFFEFCQLSRQLLQQNKTLTRLDPKFHFFAWFDNPEYMLTDEETAITVVPEHVRKYLLAFELTPNQQAWYAAKLSVMGEDMKREYPSTPDEAFEGSNEGAFYRDEMAKVRAKGGIKRVAYDRKHPVNTWWDIGQSADMMVIWFHQYINGEHRFIDYHESNGQGWDFYSKLLKDKDYVYEKHYWPHDGNKRIVGKEVLTSRQLAEQVGIRPIFVTPVTKNVYDDIRNFCRPILPDCVFDEEKCPKGIKRLDDYRRRWDTVNSMWLNDAQHDEASHGADGFRTFAVNADKFGIPQTPPPQAVRNPFPQTNAWMG
jgi:hypothetical protein